MLQTLVLQRFRNYSQKKFDFHPECTVIVGPNTAGKTNLVESILLLSRGKSFRAEKDFQMIQFGKEVAHVQGLVAYDDTAKLEVTLAQGEATGGRFVKHYLVNDVAKSQNTFIGHLPAVLFRPEELDIIVDGPGLRRSFLDEVLEPIDGSYRVAKVLYEKALRRRNALLHVVRETGRKNAEQFAYWDELLINNGKILTSKREAFIVYANSARKDIFDFSIIYDKSSISYARLAEYAQAEIASGVTLVGPQRDDFRIFMNTHFEKQDMQHFGSRGQERLAVLQLKFLQLAYTQQLLNKNPLLVLDDIFSELDQKHIGLVLEKISGQQVILTTTHKEFIHTRLLKKFAIVELA